MLCVQLPAGGCRLKVEGRPEPPQRAPLDEDTARAHDSAVPEDAGGVEHIGSNAQAGFPFDPDRIGHVSIELPDASVKSLDADPYTYTEGSVVVEGEAFDLVGVRLRGKYGSFRTLDGKPKLKIDFNQYVEDQRFEGLESLSLNNILPDCSQMKEILAAEVFSASGVIASRAMYMTVEINGEDYGLYLLVETQDDRFLDRYWADDSGNLYDGKYWTGHGWNIVMLDFGIGVDEYFQLEEGVDVGHEDIRAISETYTATRGSADYYAATGALLEWPALQRMWAASQWIGQNDGYCLNRNNYRVYFDPEDGRAELIPTDLDYSFLRAESWGFSWSAPTGNLAAACLGDEACQADWRATVAEVLDLIDQMPLPKRVEQIWALIEAEVKADPRRECSLDQVANGHDHVADWVENRSNGVREEWGL